MRSLAVLSLAAISLLGLARNAAAADPSYLAGFPDPQRITQDFKGKDRLDTLALQVAALTRLDLIVTQMAGNRRYTPDEKRVTAAIRSAAERLAAEAEAAFDPNARGTNSPREQWRAKVRAYDNEATHARLMQLYFTPAFRAELTAKLQARDARGKRAPDAKPAPSGKVREALVGATMLVLCVLGGYRLLRRPTVTTTAPHRLRVGFRRYTIAAATGTIANYSHREVKGRQDFSSNATDTGRSYFVEERFTLDGPQRREAFHLVSYSQVEPRLGNRVGQQATVLWTTKAGARLFLSIYVHGERDAERLGAATVTSQELLSRPWWTIVPAVVLAYVIGDLTVGSEYSGAIGGLIAMVVWEIVVRVLLTSRSRSLLDHVVPLAKRLAVG